VTRSDSCTHHGRHQRHTRDPQEFRGTRRNAVISAGPVKFLRVTSDTFVTRKNSRDPQKLVSLMPAISAAVGAPHLACV
jgi:hypothetical protein